LRTKTEARGEGKSATTAAIGSLSEKKNASQKRKNGLGEGKRHDPVEFDLLERGEGKVWEVKN